MTTTPAASEPRTAGYCWTTPATLCAAIFQSVGFRTAASMVTAQGRPWTGRRSRLGGSAVRGSCLATAWSEFFFLQKSEIGAIRLSSRGVPTSGQEEVYESSHGVGRLAVDRALRYRTSRLYECFEVLFPWCTTDVRVRRSTRLICRWRILYLCRQSKVTQVIQCRYGDLCAQQTPGWTSGSTLIYITVHDAR